MMVRRAPAAVVPIRDINLHSRVAIVGAVTAVTEYSFTVDDGGAHVEVMQTEDTQPDIKDIVRVIGRTQGDSIEAESISVLDGLNIDLYKKGIEVIGRYHAL